MHRIRATVVAGVLMSMAVVSCGGDDGSAGSGGELSVDEIAALFVSSGAPAEEAECVAGEVQGKLSNEEIQQFVDSADGSDVPESTLEVIGAALAECG